MKLKTILQIWGMSLLMVAVLALLAFTVWTKRDVFLAPSPPSDPMNRACNLFWEARADFGSGYLTLTELRDEIADVHDEAKEATDGPLRLAAGGMLSALTAGQIDAYLVDAREMGGACMRLGY